VIYFFFNIKIQLFLDDAFLPKSITICA